MIDVTPSLCRSGLQKKLDASERNLKDTKNSLKHRAVVHIELEDVIQKLSKQLAETTDEEKKMTKKFNAHNASIKRYETRIANLGTERTELQQAIASLKSENADLKTRVIQRDNILLSHQSKIAKLEGQYKERDGEYATLSKEHEAMSIQLAAMTAQCSNFKMDIDIFKNRLKHYEKNEVNENERNDQDKIESLRAIIDDLETQCKNSLVTINSLTAMQAEHVRFKQKYDELVAYNLSNEEKLEMAQSKYQQFHLNFQSKTEELSQLTSRYREMENECGNLRQNLNERDLELSQLQKQHHGLGDSYTDLQQQYSSYLHKNTDTSSREIKLLSERQALLKNDAQRLLLENEEWMTKYNHLKTNYDALNDDYIHSKNHSAQIEALMTESKQFQRKNMEQIEKMNARKVTELCHEIKPLGHKIEDLKSQNLMLSNKPTLSISEYTMLCEKEDQFVEIANKMFVAEQACEPSFKCTICKDLFVDPITCQPCGHSYCSKCIKRKDNMCPECKVKVKYFGNEILENLTNKFKMRFKTYLPALLQMAGRKTNVTGVATA